MEQLRIKLEKGFYIKQEMFDSVCDLFDIKVIRKGELFIKSDTYCKQLGFIKDGLMRVFALHDGKEVTQWISREDNYITDLASFLFNVPTRWNIQALTDCTLYTISQSNYSRIGNLIPNWAEIEKQFLAHCFTTLENRVFQFISLNAEERYQLYFEENKDLIAQVPQQYIASLLGMSPETLSRIRKK